MTSTNKKRIMLAVVLIGIMIAIRFSGIGQYINLDFFLQHKQYVIDCIAQWPILSRLIFILTYAVTVILAVPITNIYPMIGGYFFGVCQATVLSVISATLGSVISFMVFRYLLYESVQARYGKQLERIIQNIRTYGANYILFLELLPITPFGFIVIGASLAGLSTWTFIWATAVGIIPSTFIYAYAGSELGSLDSFGGIFAPKFVIPLLLLAVLALVPIVLRHYKIIK
jgi:uncharacterized membrane protein YdjX (TVP38/TMEM64 family)